MPNALSQINAVPLPALPPEAGTRRALLVLGMHRAGTSLLAQVIALAGAGMPRTLIGASESNRSGYWESRPIRAFDDRVLAAAGSSWDDWGPIPEPVFATLAAAGFAEEARALLASEFVEAPLVALKDPRACRLAPLWIAALRDWGAEPMAVLTLRDPMEVAASLAARDGLAPEAGHLLWLRHALDAERATRGLPRAFSSYDRLLEDWRGESRRLGQALGIDWPVPPDAVPEAEAPVRPELRHQRREGGRKDGPPLPPAPVREAQAILSRWARDGEDAADRPALDRLGAELDVAHRLAGPAVGVSRDLSRRAATAEARVAKLTEDGTSLRQQVERAEARSHGERGAAEERRRELHDLRSRLAKVEGRAAVAEELAALGAELRQALEASMSEVYSAILRPDALAQRTAQVEVELRQALEASMAEARAATRRADALAQRTAQVEVELMRRAAETARVTALLLEAERRAIRPAAWLREGAALLRGGGAALARRLREGTLPSPLATRRRMAELRRSGEFDADWYLRANLDVALSGMDPLRHYVLHGEREGRPPNGRPAAAEPASPAPVAPGS